MQDASRNELQLVSFWLAGVRYALDVTRIKEIVRLPRMTRVPKAPAHVAGVTNLRGHVIPVVNLRQRLSMTHREPDNDSRVIVVHGETGEVGFLVDAVSEILRLPVSAVTDGAELGTAGGSEHVAGVGRLGEELILLVDLDELLDETPVKDAAPHAQPALTSVKRTASPDNEPPQGRPRFRKAA